MSIGLILHISSIILSGSVISSVAFPCMFLGAMGSGAPNADKNMCGFIMYGMPLVLGAIVYPLPFILYYGIKFLIAL